MNIAGELVEVESDVTKFQIGDRVAGATLGSGNGRGESLNPEDSFQLETVWIQQVTCKIPEATSYGKICVVSLGRSTVVESAGQFPHAWP